MKRPKKSKTPPPDTAARGSTRASGSFAGLNHPDVGKVIYEFHRFNTEAARAAFAGSWLAIIATRLDHTWPVVYQLLALVRDKELYRKEGFILDRGPFESFQQFYEEVIQKPFETWGELEATYRFVRECQPGLLDKTLPEATEARRSAQALAADEGVRPLAGHGGERKEQVADSHLTPSNQLSSDSAERIVRRLKRDHKDIAAALARGEYPSARAAAIAAGIIKVPTPLDLLRRAWAKASEAERGAFIDEVGRSGWGTPDSSPQKGENHDRASA